MKESPILMPAPMVRALLEGRKTQTRRIIKKQPTDWTTGPMPGCSASWPAVERKGLCEYMTCPYGLPGDRLWIKEAWTGTWHPTRQSENHMLLHYRADESERFIDAPEDYVLPKAAAKVGNWVTPLFMPRWASRIILEVTEVRVERLQEVSTEDVTAEGTPGMVCGKYQCERCNGRGRNVTWPSGCPHCEGSGLTPKKYYEALWESINGAVSWDANPFVWVIVFKKV